MMFLSRLFIRMAFWLSPPSVVTFLLDIPSDHPSMPQLLGTASGTPSSAPSAEQSTSSDTALTLLEIQIAQAELEAAKSRLEGEKATTLYNQSLNLPHRNYGPMLTHDGLSWIASAECPDGSKIVGRGDSPQAALSDYDYKWYGINPPMPNGE